MGIEARLPRVLICLLIAFCCIMTAANFWLLRTNQSLRTFASKTIPQVSVGRRIDDVSGLGFDGKIVSLKPQNGKATLLLVYSPTCPYCEKNWPAWSQVLASLHGTNVQSATIDISASATREFISHKQTADAVLFHRIDPKELVDLNLNVTPQTILIGHDSKVIQVWTGILSNDDLKAINSKLL